MGNKERAQESCVYEELGSIGSAIVHVFYVDGEDGDETNDR